MTDFIFLESPEDKKWTILAPRRAKRPDVAKGTEPPCPFCPGREGDEKEIYRVSNVILSENEGSSLRSLDSSPRPGGVQNDSRKDWFVRVIPNKFPFAPIHEIVIHSPNHHKNFGELPVSHAKLILETYKARFIANQDKGQVVIFHNRGEKAGESLPHPHTQIAVVPEYVALEMPRLNPAFTQLEAYNTEYFTLICPQTSQWPDEVWITPKNSGRAFSEITDFEMSDFAFTLTRLIEIFTSRHHGDFPFNFYIYPGGNWYLRLIPRLKTIGGFELATGIFVNTQDPKETSAFIQEHFEVPDHEKIKTHHKASYHIGV